MLVQLFTILFWLLYVHSCTPSSIVPFLPKLLGNIIWNGRVGGVNKKTFKGKCMFPHAVSVCSSFPIPYLPPLPMVPLRSGDWKAVWFRRWLVKLHLQKAHIAILLMLYWGLFRGGLLLKLKVLLSFCANLETKKRNAIQLSRHKVWYAH